jgi:hypothetical protein
MSSKRAHPSIPDGVETNGSSGKRDRLQAKFTSIRKFVDFSPPRGVIILSILTLIGLGIGAAGMFQSNAAVGEKLPDGENLLENRPSLESEQHIMIDDLLPYPLEFSEEMGVTREFEARTIIPDRPRFDITNYLVQEGDTLFGIAEKFSLKPETILWGNYAVLQDNPHSLRPEQNLNILPIDGTYYEWSTGDELDAVANFFGVHPEDIIDWPGNNLAQGLAAGGSSVEPGTELVIPGGRREFVTWSAPRITRSNPAVARIAGPGACGSIYDGPIGEGFFIWPTTASFLSGNGYSDYHPGIDIAGSLGNAIYASASGVVVYAGWNNYGYGYMVVIDHGDGWQTLYAHMSQVSVVCGQAAFQGNVIGGLGSSGNSTGPHLHFEMQSDLYGRVNPFNFVSP